MQYYTQFTSPVGTLTALCDGNALLGLWMNAPELRARLVAPSDDPILSATEKWLAAYFAGKAPAPAEIPLAPQGTTFQMSVWALLRKIPYGGSVTYGQIAKQLGPKMSAQAVGGAVGKNPISILIPCHRVLGSDGKLTGYAGGLDKKMFLLDLEGIPYK